MLKKNGYQVWKVEQPWNRFTKVRRDLFNIIDAIAINGSEPIIGVQVTDGNNAHNHLIKALESPYLPTWLLSGGKFVIHAWRKLKEVNADGKKGKRDRWEVKEIEVVWDVTSGSLKVK